MRTERLLAEARALLRLAIPVVAAQLGLMSLGVIDVIMVGHLSKEALAAVAMGNLYAWGLMIVGQGILLSLDPLISQAHGAGDRPAVSLALQRGLLLSQLIAIPFVIAFRHAAPVLRFFGQPEEIIPVATQFVENLEAGLPPFFAFIVLRQALQAMNVVRPVLWSIAVGIIANILFNLGLVFGHFGLPAMGAPGSAISTSIGRFLMLGVLAVASWNEFREVWERPTRRLFEVRSYARMLAIGVPTGIQYGLEVWVFMTVSLLMGRLGTVALASHQVAINLASLSFMVPLGISAAAATRVGNAVGRGDADDARRAAVVSIAIGGAVMTVSALLFALVPRLLARIYTRDLEVIELTSALLPIAALFQIFDGIQAVGCGVLRGVAGTLSAALINFVGYWVLGLPLGLYLAFRVGMGPRGLWWGLTFGLMAVAVLLVLRVRWRFAHDSRLSRVVG